MAAILSSWSQEEGNRRRVALGRVNRLGIRFGTQRLRAAKMEKKRVQGTVPLFDAPL